MQECNFTLKSIKTEQIMIREGELKCSKTENQIQMRIKLKHDPD